MVVEADAVANPRAVMIHLQYALLALTTVVTSLGLNRIREGEYIGYSELGASSAITEIKIVSDVLKCIVYGFVEFGAEFLVELTLLFVVLRKVLLFKELLEVLWGEGLELATVFFLLIL